MTVHSMKAASTLRTDKPLLAVWKDDAPGAYDCAVQRESRHRAVRAGAGRAD
jgi:hypothetical protein